MRINPGDKYKDTVDKRKQFESSCVPLTYLMILTCYPKDLFISYYFISFDQTKYYEESVYLPV